MKNPDYTGQILCYCCSYSMFRSIANNKVAVQANDVGFDEPSHWGRCRWVEQMSLDAHREAHELPSKYVGNTTSTRNTRRTSKRAARKRAVRRLRATQWTPSSSASFAQCPRLGVHQMAAEIGVVNTRKHECNTPLCVHELRTHEKDTSIYAIVRLRLFSLLSFFSS